VAGLSVVCSVDDHVGAIPLAVLHLVNQSINIVLTVTELPNVRSMDNHVGAVPLAVLHLDNQ
jgi:hypothetical protein